MLTRRIKRNDEEFVVEVSEDEKRATVTDERGTTVAIALQLRQSQRQTAERLG